MISWNIGYNSNAYSRVNIDLATQQYVTQIILTTYNMQTGGGYGSVPYWTFNVYGSNSSTDYNYITNKTTNATLLTTFIPSSQSVPLTFQITPTITYGYIIVIVTYMTGYSLAGTGNMAFKLQSSTITYTNNTKFVNNTYFTVTTATDGTPLLTYVDPLQCTFIYSLGNLLISEAYRRLYPVVRDKNTLLLTDGTNTQTLSATVGYPLNKSSDCSIKSFKWSSIAI